MYLIISEKPSVSNAIGDVLGATQKKDGYLIFVEVKYRSNEQYGAPREAVDWRKRQRISNAAVFYLKRYGYSMEHPCRFDVAEVSQDSIYLMENAFDYCGSFR